MNKKIIALVSALAMCVTPLTYGVHTNAQNISSKSATGGNSVDTLELYADKASEDAGYLKFKKQQSAKDVADNGVSFPSRYQNCKKSWGVDVSMYQGNIDWSAVKKAGIDFVIIRLGYRGYGSTGSINLDSKFKTYMQGAKAAGIDTGVYFYTQAINNAEAKQEAQFCIDNLKGYTLNCPVYYDIESVDYDRGRLDSAGLSKAQKTALCDTFCSTIEAAGYESGVYANKYWLNSMIDQVSLSKKYQIWLAHFTSQSDYTGAYNSWQYSSTGTVNGIPAKVDMDVHFQTEADNEKARFGLDVSGLPKSDTPDATDTSNDEPTSEEGQQSKRTKRTGLGDVSMDGKIDSSDATAILIYYANVLLDDSLKVDVIEPTEAEEDATETVPTTTNANESTTTQDITEPTTESETESVTDPVVTNVVTETFDNVDNGVKNPVTTTETTTTATTTSTTVTDPVETTTEPQAITTDATTTEAATTEPDTKLYGGYTAEQIKNADVNRDGVVDSSDATAILIYYAEYLLDDELSFHDWLLKQYTVEIVGAENFEGNQSGVKVKSDDNSKKEDESNSENTTEPVTTTTGAIETTESESKK